MRQVELIEPRVICTLGNFSTKLLRGDPAGITRLHGQAEVRIMGRRAVRLYPLFHPAAALYTPSNVEVLRSDFARIPELLALEPPPQPDAADQPVVPVDSREAPRALPSDAVAAIVEPDHAGAVVAAATNGAANGAVPREEDGEEDENRQQAVATVPEAQLGLF